jgi:hypothetical protein
MTNKMVNGQVVPLTAEEETAFVAANAAGVLDEPASKWARIRLKRDQLLAASDWMANSDVTMSDAWTTYRQALRDVPSQSDPDNVVFPTEPS